MLQYLCFPTQNTETIVKNFEFYIHMQERKSVVISNYYLIIILREDITVVKITLMAFKLQSRLITIIYLNYDFIEHKDYLEMSV